MPMILHHDIPPILSPPGHRPDASPQDEPGAQPGVFFEPYYVGETPADRQGLTPAELDSSNRRVDRVLALMGIQPDR